MPSTTPNLSLNKGAHGDWLDFWEIPINANWDTLDALFDGATGHTHTGAAGSGPQINHAVLLNAGTLTHVQLEAGLPKAKVSAADVVAQYLENKIQAGANVTITKQNVGMAEYLEVASTGGGSAWADTDEYGDKHTTPTSAPVTYVDNFNWPVGFSLQDAGYVVETDPSPAPFDFISTGYSAKMFINPAGGDPASGVWNAVTLCHVPHSPAQRATLSITDLTEPTAIGDAVCFTLGVFATQRVGLHLPQKYGVFLEIHATCVAAGTYQVSHRVVVLPDDTVRVEFPACIHTDIADVEGCWELSLDQNGHVYVYWRRQLVYSTQTSPVSIPGPVQPYFATLTASLTAVGEPPYGSIGYGLRYVIDPESTMDIELRWFTATATDDLYHETAVCAGTPLIGPALPVYTEEFLTLPAGDGANGIPGSACCTAPDIKRVGEVLDAVSGVPSVWISACGLFEGSTLPGYITNVSNIVTPCAYMTASDVQFNFTSGPDPWEEGSRGTAVISGLNNLTPSMEVLPSTPGLNITNAVWMSHDKLFIEYTIDDGEGSTAPTLTISDAYRPANSLVITAPTIAEADLAFVGITYTLKYDGSSVASLLEGQTLLFIMTVTGADPGVTVTTTTPGVAVSFTYVNPSTIIGEITVDLQANPPVVTSVDLDIDNGSGPVTVTIPVTEPVPLIYMVDADSNAANTDPVTVVLRGALFRDGCTVSVVSGNFTISTFTYVSDTQLNLTGITGNGAVPDVVLRVSNGTGLDTDVPLLSIGAVAPTFGSASPAPMEGVKGTLVTVTGLSFFDSTYVSIAAGLSTDPLAPYASPGNCHIVSRAVNSMDILIDPVCGDGLNPVNMWLYNPGVAQLLVSPAFTVTASVVPGALTLTPATAKPGVSVVGALIGGTNITVNSTLTTASAYLTLTNIVAAVGAITFDLDVAVDAPVGSAQTITVVNPCGQTANINLTITQPNPILTSIECEFPFKGRQNQPVVLRGQFLLAGGTLAALAGCTIDSYTRISDTEVRAVLDLQNAVSANLRWTNVPGGGTDIVSLPLDPEPAPQVFHTSVLTAVEGAVNQDLYIYGRYLDPKAVGMSIALTNATALSTVTWTDTFIHLKVTITGVAGAAITAAITGTIAYPSFYVATITAGSGSISVSSITIVPTDPPMEVSVSTITIDGTGLLQVATIEVWPSVPRLGPDYIPFGVAYPGTLAITAQSDTQIVGTLTLDAALVPWSLDLQLYDSSPALLLTVASAITPTHYIGAPNPAPVVINTAIYDTIVEVSAVPQLMVFTMLDPTGVGGYFGETWGGFNAVINSHVAGPGPNDWTVNFTITAAGPYALYCYRSVLLNPDRCAIVGLTGLAT